MNLHEMLGIDVSDPKQKLAMDLMREEREMLTELVSIRRAQYSQGEIGELMGITQSAVARIESGDRDPRLSTLRRYAAALNVLIKHEVRPAASRTQEVLLRQTRRTSAGSPWMPAKEFASHRPRVGRR